MPAFGTLTGTPPNVTYTPTANYRGPDSFEFVVQDAAATSISAVVSLTVTSVPDAPVVSGGSASTVEDGSVAIALSGSDADGDALTYTIVTAPRRGTLSGVAPNLTYRPRANEFGTDSFEFVASDGGLTSSPALVNIAITPVNDAPTVIAREISAVYGSTTSIPLQGSDPDGDSLTYRVLSQPANGTLSGTAPALVYTPAVGFTGQDSFRVVANDGTVDSVEATIVVRVTLVLAIGTVGASIDTGATDAGEVVVLTEPAHGFLESGAGGVVNYRHDLDGSTLDSFVYRVDTGGNVGVPTSVALHIVGVREVKRSTGHVKVTFPTLAGLNYRLETSADSPSPSAAWSLWSEVTPVQPGLVTVAVAVPGYEAARFVRVVCEGSGQRVVSEPWGVHTSFVPAGVDGRVYSLPFRGETVFRCRVSGLSGNSLELDSAGVQLPAVAVHGGVPSHAVFSRSSQVPGGTVGTWWPILSQTGRQLTVDEQAESLADGLVVGDEVECIRLLTVADVFGLAGTADMRMGHGDRLDLDGFGGDRYSIEYRVPGQTGGAYWLVRQGTSFGPYDGTRLPLLPFQSFYFSSRALAGSLTTSGRVHDGPAIRYFHPGARMAGNAFPGSVTVPELAPYRLVEGDRPWLPAGASVTGPTPAWGSSTSGMTTAGGIWIRIPVGSPIIRWIQHPVW